MGSKTLIAGAPQMIPPTRRQIELAHRFMVEGPLDTEWAVSLVLALKACYHRHTLPMRVTLRDTNFMLEVAIDGRIARYTFDKDTNPEQAYSAMLLL